jgi:hypothetical protein
MLAYCVVQVRRGRTTMIKKYVRIDERGMTHLYVWNLRIASTYA